MTRSLIDHLLKTGIRRIRAGNGAFRYRHADGSPVSARDVDRARSLRIPPAWRNVRIAARRGALLQAIGRDAAGRWQYRYHARQESRRDRYKHARLVRLLPHLPRLRAAVARDLARGDLSREHVLATIVRILLSCFLRPGSAKYVARGGGFGIATLRPSHIRVWGDRVVFDFPGKSGRRQHRVIEDRAVARVVRRLSRIPGREVFKYRSDGGFVDVRRRDINDYVRNVTGQDFTAKDVRTWAGTLICGSMLARLACAPGFRGFHSGAEVAAAIRETAAWLGNTPAVCRSGYVDRRLIEAFRKGRTLHDALDDFSALGSRSRRVERCERSLLELLSR